MADATTPEGATPDATTAGNTNPATTNITVDTQPDLGDAGKAALEAERKARREAEKAAKAATAELDKLREASMSEQEKAVSAAKAEGRTEALREAGTRLVDAEVRAAAAGRNVDTDALLEGLDRSKFLDAEGEPDRDAIQAWMDRIAPAQEEQAPGFPSLEQGTRTPTANAALNGDPLLRDLKSKLGIR